MTCEEFVRVLPRLGEDSSVEPEAHLRGCSECSSLVEDLRAISIQAPTLRDSDEPSRKVWFALEAALREEGLIRERPLPAFNLEHPLEDESHLSSCPECSGVLADLQLISREAQLLQASEEPSPRVWNSIEIALRQEGLIRSIAAESRGLVAQKRWKLAWLIPVAAAAMALFAILIGQHDGGRHQIADNSAPVITQPAMVSSEDQQLMSLVEDRSPSLRAAYQDNLTAVDAYIREAEESVHADPQDEVAQQYLRNAYEQKAMIFEMAMNRPLQ